jgi:hypothetical protein
MKTTIELAREAGFTPARDEWVFMDMLKGFAELVRADEREQGQKWFDAVTAQHKQEILAERKKVLKEIADAKSNETNR